VDARPASRNAYPPTGATAGPMSEIRPHVIGVVRRGEEVLVTELVAPDEGPFYRPPGGGIEFGETSAEAVVREFREELDAAVEPVEFLGVCENRFEWDGEPHQELTLVHEVAFVDDARYEEATMHGVETESAVTYETTWATVAELRASEQPLYPEGVGELIEGDTVRVES
jgi:ADP-ribose pyrophosphatase YjhB (NUDIX family)